MIHEVYDEYDMWKEAQLNKWAVYPTLYELTQEQFANIPKITPPYIGEFLI